MQQHQFLWGVAASLVAWLLGLWIIHQLIPWLQGIIWHVTDISGRWLAYAADPDTSEPVGEAHLRQRGTRVRMSLHRQRDSTGKLTSRKYKYEGTFRARQLTLLWQAEDRPDFRIGAMVLHLTESGTQFKGLTVFYDDAHPDIGSGIGSRPYWLLRPLA